MLLPSAAAQTKARKSGARPPARSAEQKSSTHKRTGRDPAIAQVIKEVSPARIEQTINKLVSFHTRSTLSVNNPGASTSDRGIVAARNWIKSELERYSADCGGCLEVKTDTYIEQSRSPRDRITQTTEIQNVYAVLKGTDPQ